jgi:hypothetical protein
VMLVLLAIAFLLGLVVRLPFRRPPETDYHLIGCTPVRVALHCLSLDDTHEAERDDRVWWIRQRASPGLAVYLEEHWHAMGGDPEEASRGP